jgi:DNA adenine methylase
VQEKQLLFLLDKLNEQGVKWAISNMTHHKGKENNIFIEWANKYNMVSIESNYISYHDNSIKDKSREVLVKNYG